MSLEFLTPLEKKAYDALLNVRIHLTSGKKVGQQEFGELMGTVRNALIALENKVFGCPTGTHSGLCSCIPAQKGRTLYYSRKRETSHDD